MIVDSLKETKQLAKDLKKNLLPQSKALIIGLKGELGSGKTAFVQLLAREFGIKEKVLSPTFVILKSFILKNQKFEKFYHLDCYRINKSQEILNLGFKEIIENNANIVLIEWVGKIEELLPKDTMILEFKFINQNKREINVKKKIYNS